MIVADRCDPGAVRREGNVVDGTRVPGKVEAPPANEVPQPQRAVLACRGEELTFGREGQDNGTPRAAQRALFARHKVPNLDTIDGARGQQLAIGREGDAVRHTVVLAEDPFLVGLRSPKDDFAIAVAECDMIAVGRGLDVVNEAAE